MRTILRAVVAAIVVSFCAAAAAQDDVADVPSQKLQAGGDTRKTYFLIGPGKDAKPPELGYKLLVVLPGGDGTEAFHPFVKRIYRFALPEGYMAAQLVAFKWTPDQQIVWPQKKDLARGMKFATEAFIEAVVADVAKQHKIDSRRVFTLSWSSGGPAAYGASLQKKTPITGSYVAMSVFNQKQLPPLSAAKGRAYYIEHSPDDKVCPFWMAEKAVSELGRAGAKVELCKCEGDHGWQGDVFGRMRKAIVWLEENTK